MPRASRSTQRGPLALKGVRGFQGVVRPVLGTEEKEGLPEREVISKGAGVRSHRTTGEDSSPQPVQGFLEESSKVDTGERQAEGVCHAAT